MDTWIPLRNPLNIISSAAILSILLSSILLLPHQASIAQVAGPDFIVYSNADYGLSVSYPETWTLEEDNTYLESEYDVVGFFSPASDESDTAYEYVTIAVIPGVTSDESLGEIAESAIAVFEETVENFDLEESVATTLAGKPAQRIVYTGTFFGTDAKAMMIMTIENQSLYVFKFFGAEQEYPVVLPLVNQIASSLEISVVQDGEDTSELVKFTNSTYGIGFSYPESWSIVEGTVFGEEGQIPNFVDIVLLESPSSALEIPVNFHVGVERIPMSFSIDQYTEASLQYVEAGDIEIEMLESAETTLSGKRAHKIVYIATFIVDGFESEVKLMQAWTVDAGLAYVITYAAAEAGYDRHLQTVNDIVSSFQITAAQVPTDVITNEYVPFENEALAVSLEVPENWQQFSDEEAAGFFTPTYSGGVSIFKWDGAGLFTLEQLTDKTIEQLRKQVSLFRLLESNSTTLSGLPAHKIVYTGLSDPFGNGKELMYKVTSVWTLSGARAYVVTYAIFEEEYPTYLPVAERMIGSLEIDEASSPKLLTGRFTEPASKLEIVLPEDWRGFQSPQLSAGESPFISGVFVAPQDVDLTKLADGSASDVYAMMILTGDIADIMASSDGDSSCMQSSSPRIDFVNSGLKALVFLGECEYPFLKDSVKVKSYALAKTDGMVVFFVFMAGSSKVYEDHIAEFEDSVRTAKLQDALDLSDPTSVYKIESLSKYNYKVSSETVVVGGKDYGLRVATNSTLSDFTLDEGRKTVSFKVDGSDGTSGVTDIEISKVLSGPYTVMVDGQPAEGVSMLEDNTANVTVMTISYPHSVHEITIAGTNVVSEFPFSIMIVAFASIMGVAVVMRKRQAGL